MRPNPQIWVERRPKQKHIEVLGYQVLNLTASSRSPCIPTTTTKGGQTLFSHSLQDSQEK